MWQRKAPSQPRDRPPLTRDGPYVACQVLGSLPGWSWGNLPDSHYNLPAFLYSVIIYGCQPGTLVALETESDSRLETRRPRVSCTISTKYDNCSCSGLSPFCSGALETTPTSGSWKTRSNLSGAHRENFRPLTWSTRWFCQASNHLSSHILLQSPHPRPATLTFSLFLKYSYLASNLRAFALIVPWPEVPFDHMPSRLASSGHLGLCLNVTSSERPSQIASMPCHT